MTLTLDTNVIVELVRGRQAAVRGRFYDALAHEHRVVASLIVYYELRFGCALHADPIAELKRLQAVLAKIPIEPFDEGDMVAAANVRAALRRRGQMIGGYDLLIAGQALARDWTVVTANIDGFSRIDGLNVIDWTVAAD